MSPEVIKGLVVLLVFLATFGAGMKVEDWRRDSSDLSTAKEAQANYAKAVENSERVAAKVEGELNRLATFKTVVTKEITHETQRVEYRCALPASGRLLYVRAAEGDSSVTGDLPKPVPAPSDSARNGGPR